MGLHACFYRPGGVNSCLDVDFEGPPIQVNGHSTRLPIPCPHGPHALRMVDSGVYYKHTVQVYEYSVNKL